MSENADAVFQDGKYIIIFAQPGNKKVPTTIKEESIASLESKRYAVLTKTDKEAVIKTARQAQDEMLDDTIEYEFTFDKANEERTLEPAGLAKTLKKLLSLFSWKKPPTEDQR